VHLLNEQHRVVFVGCHQKVVVCQPHQAIEFYWHAFLFKQTFGAEELQLAVFEVHVVEARQDVRHAQSLRNPFGLLELLFVKRDVVVLCDVLQRSEQVVAHMLFALFLFHHDCPLEIQVVFFLQDIKQRRVRATINTNFLELVPEMIFNRLLLKSVSG
jgi:hypothetical protein